MSSSKKDLASKYPDWIEGPTKKVTFSAFMIAARNVAGKGGDELIHNAVIDKWENALKRKNCKVIPFPGAKKRARVNKG